MYVQGVRSRTLSPCVCGRSEVPGPAGHVQDPEDPPQVCPVPQGPDPPVSGRQGRVHPPASPGPALRHGKGSPRPRAFTSPCRLLAHIRWRYPL